MRLPVQIGSALATLHGALTGAESPWLVGGSCGLLLQGVAIDAAPRDLDLYSDAPMAEEAHGRLLRYAADRLELSRTEMYESLLCHYHIDGVPVEWVGGFRVFAAASHYTVEAELMAAYAAICGPLRLKLMPLAHELVFNVLRGRPERYEAISATMRGDPDNQLPALQAIVRRNRLSRETLMQIARLIPGSPWKGES